MCVLTLFQVLCQIKMKGGGGVEVGRWGGGGVGEWWGEKYIDDLRTFDALKVQ